MASALRNAVKRRTHKERSQPSDRRKFGLLEKKKDYLQRARDFHKKDNEIQNLRRKAEQRNPDEFYFAMERRKTKGGVVAGSITNANKYTAQELRFMKSQDANYLALKAQAEMKKAERLQSQLHFIGAATPRQHRVFVDDEAAVQSFSPEQHFDTASELLDRSYNRPRTAHLQQLATTGALPDDKQRQRSERRKQAAYQELQQRQARQGSLSGMAASMDMESTPGFGRSNALPYCDSALQTVMCVQDKGRKRKLQPCEMSGDQTKVFRWKQVRQR